MDHEPAMNLVLQARDFSNPADPADVALTHEQPDHISGNPSRSPAASGLHCMICKERDLKDPFIPRCSHVFCRSCVTYYVRGQLSDLTRMSVFGKALMWIRCPDYSCNQELGRQELIALIGLPATQDYERCMADYYDVLYEAEARRASRMVCLKGICDQETATSVLADRLSNLTSNEVKHALEVRGLSFQRSSKKHYIKFLLSYIGVDKEDSNKTWVCTTCDAAWCGHCGSRIPMHPQERDDYAGCHSLLCDGEKKYGIYMAISSMKEAWHCYKSFSRKSSDKPFSCKWRRTPKSIWADGTGFGGDSSESRALKTAMAAKGAESELDLKLVTAMDNLIGLLNQRSECLSSATCALIYWDDTLRQVLSHLATNDSMLDVCDRRNIYQKMTALINILAEYSELIPILTEGSSDQASSSKTVDAGEAMENITNSSLVKQLENLHKQGTIMVDAMEAEESDLVVSREVELAKEICSCYKAIARIAEANKVSHVAPGAGVTSNQNEHSPQERKYKEILKQLQFKTCSLVDSGGRYRHSHENEILGNVRGSTSIDKQGAHNYKRTLYISKDIASLSTNLPLEWGSSIYVCVDEERMDVLKAMIIGPHDTPYQNGIFVFDIFLPPDYPQVPPKVKFLTTGGGSVRFNPNLYQNGEICLSLLGTWSGPGWLPWRSTILQVLVSLQSLIFVKDPFYNEPGYESHETPKAEIMNMQLRKDTLSHAILAALQAPDTFFKEIIVQHFKLKKEEVEAQCDEWVACALKGDQNNVDFIARKIKAEMQAL